MKERIIIAVVAVSVAVALILIEWKKRQNASLGKLPAISKPAKMRIVYSRKQDPKNRKKITSSTDAYNVFKSIWSSQIETREEMVLLFLDRSNHVLGYHLLSYGGITGTVADLRLIFSVALQSLATSFVLAHSHPSGNLNPSQSDISVTNKIKDAGQIMDIQLLDHLIMTRYGYYSFADEGNL